MVSPLESGGDGGEPGGGDDGGGGTGGGNIVGVPGMGMGDGNITGIQLHVTDIVPEMGDADLIAGKVRDHDQPYVQVSMSDMNTATDLVSGLGLALEISLLTSVWV